MNYIIRILIFFSFLASTSVFAENKWSFDSENNLNGPMIIGNLDADVKVIEYRSLTCSHCAEFASNGFLHLKEKYIDTGLISFELRPFPLNALDLNAFKLLYCASKESFHKLDKVLLKNQSKWIDTSDQEKVLENSTAALTKQAALFGVSSNDYKSCLENEEITNFILKNRIDAVKEYGVNSTPSFLINGDLYAGSLSADRIDELLEGYIN
jgi:protein-disulfide isomerase